MNEELNSTDFFQLGVSDLIFNHYGFDCSIDAVEETKYKFWLIQYKSCEGNHIWTVARSPINWEEYEVRDRISMGGCGDDVAEIKDIVTTSNTDYIWDFCY